MRRKKGEVEGGRRRKGVGEGGRSRKRVRKRREAEEKGS